MSDSTSAGLNPVDQGTVVMLSLCFGLLTIALVYFTCMWYRKRKRQAVTKTTTSAGSKPQKSSKTNVMRSFSRFSQVDEELTFYPDETDLDLHELTSSINDGRPTSASPKRNQQIRRARAATQTTKAPPTQAVKTQHRMSAPPGERKYMETSI